MTIIKKQNNKLPKNLLTKPIEKGGCGFDKKDIKIFCSISNSRKKTLKTLIGQAPFIAAFIQSKSVFNKAKAYDLLTEKLPDLKEISPRSIKKLFLELGKYFPQQERKI